MIRSVTESDKKVGGWRMVDDGSCDCQGFTCFVTKINSVLLCFGLKLSLLGILRLIDLICYQNDRYKIWQYPPLFWYKLHIFSSYGIIEYSQV